MKFARRVIPDPITIRLKRSEESLSNIKQFYVECRDQEDKFNALSNLYGVISIGQSMIFCHVSINYVQFTFLDCLSLVMQTITVYLKPV